MCEVCKSEGEDYLYKNGPKKQLISNNLYKVFKNSIAPIKLCYVHNIELFHLGERRFLRGHLDFARGLAKKNRVQLSSEESNFGF